MRKLGLFGYEEEQQEEREESCIPGVRIVWYVMACYEGLFGVV